MFFRYSFLLALLISATHPAFAAEDKVLRWASAGDVQTLDPDSLNEEFTNNLNNLVYQTLVDINTDESIVPSVAASWTLVNDTTWRIKVRQGLRFHDGTLLTADDVVFSVERAQDPLSKIGQYAKALGKPTKVNEDTVEFRQEHPDPQFVFHMRTVFVMSKAWCIEHHSERPADYNNNAESYASMHENGSGPFVLKSRVPGVKTVYVLNPVWGEPRLGNVTEIDLTPIADSSTRLAALLSGDINFVNDPAPQDVARVSANPDIRVSKAIESRILFMGMDQKRDELLYSSVKGHNPFKDQRVREAIFSAIDVPLIAKQIMRGEAQPTSCMTMGLSACLDSNLEMHPPADPARAKKLLAEAGYPNGFEVTLDCPNNRYVADAAMCQAIVGMLARVGITVDLNAQPKATFFPKVYKQDTSFFMYGWGGSTPDAGTVLDPLAHSFNPSNSLGLNNDGRFSDPELDRIIETADQTMAPDIRRVFIIQALDRLRERLYYLPLLRPGINWLSAKNVKPVIIPGNRVMPHWFVIS